MHYGELRFVGLDKEQLSEALLECQSRLLEMGLISLGSCS